MYDGHLLEVIHFAPIRERTTGEGVSCREANLHSRQMLSKRSDLLFRLSIAATALSMFVAIPGQVCERRSVCKVSMGKEERPFAEKRQYENNDYVLSRAYSWPADLSPALPSA